MSTDYGPQFPWSVGKWEGYTGKRSGIRCKMCTFLHIGGLGLPTGRYASRPGGPGVVQGGGGGKALMYHRNM